MSKVCVHNNLVSQHFRTFDSNAGHCFTFIDEGLDWSVEADVDTHFLCDFSHAGCDASKAALGVENAVFVLQESENGEQRWSVEGTHAEVLGLKRHCKSHALIVEVLAEISSNAGPRLEDGRNSEGSL